MAMTNKTNRFIMWRRYGGVSIDQLLACYQVSTGRAHWDRVFYFDSACLRTDRQLYWIECFIESSCRMMMGFVQQKRFISFLPELANWRGVYLSATISFMLFPMQLCRIYILVKQDREILLQIQENQPVCKRINADKMSAFIWIKMAM